MTTCGGAEAGYLLAEDSCTHVSEMKVQFNNDRTALNPGGPR